METEDIEDKAKEIAEKYPEWMIRLAIGLKKLQEDKL